MFPDAICDSCSLGPNRPALTISSKVNAMGEILDTKLSSSILRKVTKIDYKTASSVMIRDGEKETDPETFSVGPEVPQSQSAKEKNVTDKQKHDLRLLRHLAEANRMRRLPNGDIIDIPDNARVSAYFGNEGFQPTPRQVESSISWSGDPAIQLHVPRTHIGGRGPLRGNGNLGDLGRSVVQDVMTIAGQAAAMWCHQRGLPVPFRGTVNSFLAIDGPDVVRDRISHLKTATGQLPIAFKSATRFIIGTPLMSSSPIPHGTVNTPMYVKFTSALRRYVDCVAHWQVEAALREEARIGGSLVGNTSDHFLPFSKAELDASFNEFTWREYMCKNTKNSSNRHWMMMFFLRALQFREAAIPRTVEFVVLDVRSLPAGFVAGFNPKLGVVLEMHHLVGSEIAKEVVPGDVWEVELERVITFDRSIVTKPIRLISKFCSREEWDSLKVYGGSN
jgi:hypothetical protein